MQVEYLTTMSLPDEEWDVNMLEEACWEAAWLLSAEIGEKISHYPTHRWVQRKGRVLKEEDRRWQATFEYSEAFESEGEPNEIVVTELDATMIHPQEGKGKNIAVKLSIMYSGKESESNTSEYKRYRLKDKALQVIVLVHHI